MLTDLDLIENLKVGNETAVQELITRYTGLYINIMDRFTYLSPIDQREMEDQRPFNIYKYAMDYDASKNTKFNTYLSNRIVWDCKDLHKKSVIHEEVTEENVGAEEIFSNELFREIERIAKGNADTRFITIFKLRHEDSKPTQWWKIAEQMNLSTEGARQIYNKNMKVVKKILKEEVL